jgi:hypothetical protein
MLRRSLRARGAAGRVGEVKPNWSVGSAAVIESGWGGVYSGRVVTEGTYGEKKNEGRARTNAFLVAQLPVLIAQVGVALDAGGTHGVALLAHKVPNLREEREAEGSRGERRSAVWDYMQLEGTTQGS